MKTFTTYYPFGLKHNAYVPTKKDVKYQEAAIDEKEIKQVQPAEVVYKYKYNSKELQDELGLGVYDYGARIYDPAVPRFWTIDPLSEKYHYQSTYVYADNNPVLFRDILGMGVETDYKIDKKTGKVSRVDENDGSENNKNDRLFATDDNGNVDKSVDPLVINKKDAKYSTIISEIANNEVEYMHYTGDDTEPIDTRQNYAVSQSRNKTFSFFRFVAKNSDVEWSVTKFSINKQKLYFISTYHIDDLSPDLSLSGKAIAPGSKLLFMIHSHPKKLAWDKASRVNSMDGDNSVALTYKGIPYYVYFSYNNSTTLIKGRYNIDGIKGFNRPYYIPFSYLKKF